MNMEGLLGNLRGSRQSQLVPRDISASMAASSASGLKRHHNDMFLPPPYTGQTAEVVWKNIEKRILEEDVAGSYGQRQRAHEELEECQERRDPGGEMTLEDFLVMAGVPRNEGDATSCLSDGSNVTVTPLIASQSGSDSLQSAIVDSPSFQSSDMINYASQHPQQNFKQPDMAASRRGYSLSVMIPNVNKFSDSGLMSPDSPAAAVLSPCLSDYPAYSMKPLTPDAFVDKAMEKRQKRMIKNRESAARSRARKQAYTIELEAEALRLREENARLKKQQMFANYLHQTRCPPPLKIRVLQRSRSW